MPKTLRQKLRRAEKISFCPDCGKRFANETRVLQHMNQPSNTCGSWINELSQAYHNYFHAPARTYTRTTARYRPDRDVVPEVDGAYAHGELGPDEDSVYNPDDGWQQEDAPGLVFNTHPNTPSIHPGGTTFMDRFFSDQYADLQQENLYYPFVSRIDWQFASWLLRSCLSMAAIDDLLSLELVCQFSFTPSLKLTCIIDQAAAHFLSICKRAKASRRNATIGSQVEIARSSPQGSD